MADHNLAQSFHKHALDKVLDEEIRSYRQLLEDEKISAGADSETARREAAIELGAIEMIKEQVRALSCFTTYW